MTRRRPTILVSNDDGIHSEGIGALAEALAALGEVVVVAPDRERSAVSHSLTLHRPLRVELLAPQRYAVDGTQLSPTTPGHYSVYVNANHVKTNASDWDYIFAAATIASATACPF